MFNLVARVQTRIALREAGYGFFDISRAMAACTDDTIKQAVAASGVTVPGEVAVGVVGALGDGTIIAAIIAFLQSDQGKALIQILMTMLLALIGA